MVYDGIREGLNYYDNHEKSKEYTRINKTKYRAKNRELLKIKESKRKEYQKSFGGRLDDYNNNTLLRIDPFLFE
jgi:hypothetical protein